MVLEKVSECLFERRSTKTGKRGSVIYHCESNNEYIGHYSVLGGCQIDRIPLLALKLSRLPERRLIEGAQFPTVQARPLVAEQAAGGHADLKVGGNCFLVKGVGLAG